MNKAEKILVLDKINGLEDLITDVCRKLQDGEVVRYGDIDDAIRNFKELINQL